MKSLRSWKNRKTSHPRRTGGALGMEQLEYRLLLAGDTLEPNDTFAGAANLGTGDQTHEHLSIDQPGNDDYYRWTASADGLLTVDVLFTHTVENDLDVNLFDSDQDLKVSSTTQTDNEHIEWEVVADQVYVIHVLGFFGAVQSDYTLVIDGPDPEPDDFEPNDTLATATNLGTGDKTVDDLTLHKPGDEDWYGWTAPDDGTLTVDVRFSQALGNVDLEIYDSGATRLTFSNSNTDNESASVAVAAGQQYFVRVFGVDGDVQRDYDLALNGPDIPPDRFEPNDAFAAATDLQTEDQTQTDLSIHEVGNDDWYQWRSPAKGTLSVDVLLDHSLGDLNLQLYDSARNLLATSATPADIEHVSSPVVADGVYFIRVFGAEGALQSVYTLTIDGPEPPIFADAFEPNDSFSSAADLGGSDQTHTQLTIHEPGNDDWYKWSALADGTLSVQAVFKQTQGDVNLQLYDAQENLIEESISTTDNEELTATVVAGQKYVIRAFGANDDVQRRYDLVIDAPAILPDPLEPNNTFAAAADLGTRDQTYEGLTIHEPGDDDWYRWTPTRNGTLNVELRFRSGLGDLDLELYDEDRVLLVESNTSSDVEQVTHENALAGVPLYIHVFGAGTGFPVQPDYDMVINGPGPDQDKFEPNDSPAAAADLGMGDQAHKSLTIHELGNDDWYQWTASADGTLTVDVLFEHILGNVDLEVFDSSQALVGQSRTSTNNEHVSVPVEAGQAYLVRVLGIGEPIQPNYSLVLNGPGPAVDRFEPNDSMDQATDLGGGDQAIKGLSIHGPDNDDWFQWTAAADGTLVVDLAFEHATGDLNLQAYDASETMLAESTSMTDNEQVSVPVVAGGEYFVRVFGADGAIQDDYDLIIQSNDPPTIAPIDDHSTDEDVKIPAISLTIGDSETNAELLTLGATSSNASLVPDGNLLLGGNGPDRTLAIVPVANQSGQTTITVEVRDPQGGTSTQAFELFVTAVADLPTLVVNDASGDESAAIPLDIAASLADTDGSETLSIHIAGVPEGASLSAGHDDGAGNWTLSPGDLTELTLTPAANPEGDLFLSVSAISVEISNGDSARAGDPDNLRVTVSPVNNAPVNTVPNLQTVDEDTPLVFSEDRFNGISISDPDAAGANIVTSITVGQGTLRVANTNSLVITGNGTNGLTMTGSVTAINAGLEGLVYMPREDFHGMELLTVTTDDGGHSGAGGPLADTDTVEIAVQSVNDPPEITSDASATVQENATAVLTVTASDPDGDSLLFAIGGGADQAVFQIDAATGALRFKTAPDYENPTDTGGDNVYQVQITADDGQGAIVSQSIEVTVTDVDETAPSVEIIAVSPDPRVGMVDEISIVFSELVTGFDLGDLALTRAASATVGLLPGGATLTTTDNMVYTLGNLDQLTGGSGNYQLTLAVAGSGIQDAAGNSLEQGAAEQWTSGAGDANEDRQFNQVDVIMVLQAFKYRTGQPATWAEGDWNGDGLFDQFDVILAQQTLPPHYLQGPFAATRSHADSGPASDPRGALVDAALSDILDG